VVEQPGDGCLAQKSYEEAEAHCVDSGHRLCTLAEMLGSPKSDGDCNGARFNWVSTECGTEPDPEPESFHWIAAGDPTEGWNAEVFDTLRVCESDSAVSTSQAVPNSYDIAVTCCSDDGSKVFDAFAEGCVYLKSYEEAEAQCHLNGYRLCTLEEMLSSPKPDGDCNGGRFNWVSTECGSTPTTASDPEPVNFVLGPSTMKWQQAEDWCLANYGTHLASIHNDEEWAEANDICGTEQCWLGGTCQDGEHGDWLWTDGSSWDYTHWNPGQPDNYYASSVGDDCVQQYRFGAWADQSCSYSNCNPLCAAPELSHWIAAGDPTEWWDTAHTLKVCETDSTKTTSHAISFDDDEIAVTCCTDDGVKVVEQPGDGCLAQKSYEEAEAHCVDSGHRLCTLAEMLGSPKSDGDCNGARFNWVSTECGTEPDPEPESFHWIAAGDPTEGWNAEVFDTLRVCESDSAVSTSQAVPNSYDIAVTCCSDDGSKVFDGIDASDEGCVYQKSYEDAEAHCHIDGYRLCTLEEMLSSPKSDGDCNGGRFNWVSTECVPDAHLVVQGRISWGGWGAAPDSYCQLDDDNQAAYDSSKHDRNIGVGCCSMDGTTGYRPDCNAHPATYQEAVDLCSSTVKNGERLRLCTLQEMLYGKSNGRGITEGKGCWYDAAYQWVSDECDMGANAAAPMANEGSASDGEGRAFEFGDFLPMVLGAAAGIAVLSGVVVLVVATKRKRSAKKEETEMAKVVHVPETSPASVDGVETI